VARTVDVHTDISIVFVPQQNTKPTCTTITYVNSLITPNKTHYAISNASVFSRLSAYERHVHGNLPPCLPAAEPGKSPGAGTLQLFSTPSALAAGQKCVRTPAAGHQSRDGTRGQHHCRYKPTSMVAARIVNLGPLKVILPVLTVEFMCM